MSAMGAIHLLTTPLLFAQKESKLEEGEEAEEEVEEEEEGVIKAEAQSGREKGSRAKKAEGTPPSHHKPEEEEQSVPRTKRNRTGDTIMKHNKVSCVILPFKSNGIRIA